MPVSKPRRLFVLDTNVLMHDPAALFRFQEHDIFIPMVVLEELDASKKGLSEVARNTRQASRFLDDLIQHEDSGAIENGLVLTDPGFGNGENNAEGKLYLQTQVLEHELPGLLPGKNADNTILGITLSLSKMYPERLIILVSKDINLRIKARVLGVRAEDYYNDKVLDDASLLYRGIEALPDNFWDKSASNLASWSDNSHTFYKFKSQLLNDCYPNECLYSDEVEDFEAIVNETDGIDTTVRVTRNYRNGNGTVWGINARNREQNFALNLLMDPGIDLVTLTGVAGTGKTLLTLAAALQQTIEEKRYLEIIMTRVTVPVGEDIGYLPGTEEEKMTPWMGALMDNLEVLTNGDNTGEWEKAATADLIHKRIKIRSLNFMRGRTFMNRFVILDEAQNLSSKQMKTLITRIGPGSKIICLGNISQIDTPYLTETNSGLTYVVDRFKNWPYSGHITLQRGERSRLADFASAHL